MPTSEAPSPSDCSFSGYLDLLQNAVQNEHYSDLERFAMAQNLDIARRVWDESQLDKKLYNQLDQLSNPVLLRCGISLLCTESAYTLPWLDLMAESSDLLQVSLFIWEQDQAGFQAFFPGEVFFPHIRLTRKGHHFSWGPRPRAATDLVQSFQPIEAQNFEAFQQALIQFHEQEGAMAIQADFIDLFKQIQS